jgi:hypothetical protein
LPYYDEYNCKSYPYPPVIFAGGGVIQKRKRLGFYICTTVLAVGGYRRGNPVPTVQTYF